MEPTQGIFFEETSGEPGDFRALADPGLPGRPISPQTVLALKQSQVARLETNVVFLRKKQEEFNRKVEEYVQSIRALILSLKNGAGAEARGAGTGPAGTEVRCLTCGAAKVFGEILVVQARDSLTCLSRPTELIVDDAGQIKKGSFRCPRCGNGNLLIREVATP